METEIAELPKCQNNLVSTQIRKTQKNKYITTKCASVQNHTSAQKYLPKDTCAVEPNAVQLTFAHKFGYTLQWEKELQQMLQQIVCMLV